MRSRSISYPASIVFGIGWVTSISSTSNDSGVIFDVNFFKNGSIMSYCEYGGSMNIISESPNFDTADRASVCKIVAILFPEMDEILRRMQSIEFLEISVKTICCDQEREINSTPNAPLPANASHTVLTGNSINPFIME